MEAGEEKRHSRYISDDACVERHGNWRSRSPQPRWVRPREGSSLQEAADELIRHLLELVVAFRSSGCSASCELRPDLETMNFLQELGEIAAAGGDIRARVSTSSYCLAIATRRSSSGSIW